VNELVSRDDHTYSYDANGNMTGDGIRTYTWDAENRLVGIGYVDHPEKKSSFQYDGLNRRAVMVETHGSASTTSTFLWDGTDLLMEQTEKETKWYYPQGEIHGKESLFYVSDRLGSVRETVNQDHLITARMSYTAYGETQTALTPFVGKAPDYRYAGLFFHEQSGLYLAVFRAYDPKAGRWINRDPIGEDGGVNLYAYSETDPVSNLDVLGLKTFIVYKPLPHSEIFPGGVEAPPGTSFIAEENYARSHWSISGIRTALGHGGLFDLQRKKLCDGNYDVFPAYRNATNYGVGVYEGSVGWMSWPVAFILNMGYALEYDRNPWSVIWHDAPYWRAGYLEAKNGRVATPIGTLK
jgi:RHS repeat-associated protein